MRRILSVAAIAGTVVLSGAAQAGGLVGLVGNDTGGIIPWSPVNEQLRLAIASQHCAYFGKYARITSVYRQYGHYIGFRCLFGPPARAVLVRLY
jgi:hypothetical protein